MTKTMTRLAIPMAGFELRQVGNQLNFTGYASTFDEPYDMGFYKETVRSGAFTKTLSESPDVRFLVNHDGLPLARTKSGTMQLAQDTTGLHVDAQLDASSPLVAELRSPIERGDLDAMSFAFGVVKQEWSPDYDQRDFIELSLAGGDVSVVTYPANPNTTLSLRMTSNDPTLELSMRRFAAKRAIELREGKQISAANVEILQRVLDALAVIDGYVDQVDADLDDAQQQLSDFLGVVNPDPADDETPDEGDLTGSDSSEPADEEVAAARSLRSAQAIAEALRLHKAA